MEEYEPIWELQVPVWVRDVLADTTWYSAFPLRKGHLVALSSGSLRCLDERVLLGGAGRGWFPTVACNEVTRWEQNNKSFDVEVIFFP